jgi:hypothetical protein
MVNNRLFGYIMNVTRSVEFDFFVHFARKESETNGLVFFPVRIGELGYDSSDRLGLVVSGEGMLSILKVKSHKYNTVNSTNLI